MANGPATTDAVAAMLRLPADDPDLPGVVSAVNAFVARLPFATNPPADPDADPPEPPTWPDDVTQGANMLAARLYRRRNSPAGVESVSELGAVYVQRNDPDVAMMLGIGGYAHPIVG